MTDQPQITLEEALKLVDFEFVDGAWRVKRVAGGFIDMRNLMTDKHPLTDEIIDTLASPQYDCFEGVGDVNCGFTYDDMRAAADWQLKQVIQLWYQCLQCMLGEPGLIEGIRRFDQKLRAMLPTTPTEEN